MKTRSASDWLLRAAAGVFVAGMVGLMLLATWALLADVLGKGCA